MCPNTLSAVVGGLSRRLYLEDSYRRDFEANVVGCVDHWCALSETAFHPGGGGQPCDRGQLFRGSEGFAVSGVRDGPQGLVWHLLGTALEPGQVVRGAIDWPFRYALMRHHALMHIVNTVAFRHFGAMMTGAQLGPESSRIDLALADFQRSDLGRFEILVNDAIQRALAIVSRVISDHEFRARPELVRTVRVQPPIIDGTVRIVEIADFDAQACGGTHVHSTAEIGVAHLVKFDNKGKSNKRLYWELDSS